MIYLDYNATTPLAPQALEAMLPYLREHHGNPSSVHGEGRQARAAIDSARDRMASVLGIKSHEVIFTAGGTEADNLAVLGLARAQRDKGRHIISARTEHHAVLNALEYLEAKEGFQVTWLAVDGDGRVDPGECARSLTSQTTLVSLMSANNETGTLQPVEEISLLCREKGVLFHCDAIQSFGKEPVLCQRFDAVSLAAHKFYGPKGVGMLYVRAGVGVERLQHGGAHENQRRPGTENVAGIVGMAAAAELAECDREKEQPRLARLRDRLWDGILHAWPEARRNGSERDGLANTLNVSFPGADGEALLMNLDLAGICASSGAACMVGSLEPSHVLAAMGLEPALARAAVRFSLGRLTTEAEVDETAARMGPIRSLVCG